MKETYFTDEEYRIVLAALGRERKVCEMIDKDSCEHKLLHIMNSIEKKIHDMQYGKVKQNPAIEHTEDNFPDLTQIAVHCKTEEEAKEFIRMAFEHGYHWTQDGVHVTNWNSFAEKTVYSASEINPNHLLYGDIKNEHDLYHTSILEFAELKLTMEQNQEEQSMDDYELE